MVEQIWKDKIVVHRFSGRTSTDEIRRASIRIAGNARFDDLTEIVYDFSACDGAIIHPDTMEEIAALDGAASRTNPRIRITFISNHPEIIAAADIYTQCGLSCYPVDVCASPLDRPWIIRLLDPAVGRGLAWGS